MPLISHVSQSSSPSQKHPSVGPSSGLNNEITNREESAPSKRTELRTVTESEEHHHTKTFFSICSPAWPTAEYRDELRSRLMESIISYPFRVLWSDVRLSHHFEKVPVQVNKSAFGVISIRSNTSSLTGIVSKDSHANVQAIESRS